ncbi:DnaJ domain-containing protein [Desulfobacter latus]|uniref:DnaJ domain-containing protein n=1 Tax=Desulfobacter latus TaxID=2292 RepID=A0A850T909_9BACT|nr:DnaJ domain-containing protein [Desulfobacter latus]NWH05705.1 DnaJ domain-containing protein [Desulfobacter latus]
MSPLVKFILILLGLAYLISPVDAIPELYLPMVGWIDDSLVIWCLYHLLRYGRLPSFLFKKGNKQSSGEKGKGSESTQKTYRKTGPNRANATGQSTKANASNRTSIFKSPYEILGVDDSASWSEIQTAYKNKAKQYHPDKLSHLGEEFSTLANEKFLEIQQAYAKLKSIYNP